MVVGDIGSNNLIFLQNGGTPNHADIVSFDANWPASNPVDISIFPAAYFVDIDADDNRDLVVAPNDRLFSENRFGTFFYRNTSTDSTPNFTFFQDNLLIEDMLDFGSGAMPVLVDYDLDGKTDLLVSNYGNYDFGDFVPQIALFKNNGTNDSPFFDLIEENVAGLGFQSLSPGIRPTLGDLDNDGDLDMILGKADGSLDFYRNTSVSPTNVLPQFSLEISDFEGIDVGGSASPVLFDLNQDGLLDLVVGERDGNLNYYENTGTAEVPAFTLISNTFGGVNVSIDGFQPGYSVPSLYQKEDNISLLIGSDDGHVYYWKNIAPLLSEAFGPGEAIISPGAEGNRLAPAMMDLNDDAFPDMLVGNFGGGIALYQGKQADSTMVSIAPSLTEAPKILIWPNPAEDALNWHIQTSGLISGQAKLFDLQGRLVQSWSVDQARHQQTLSRLGTGVYVLEIQLSDHQPFRQKLMIHTP
ncbi:MAG: FG-GAP-like repeat-containing protein [Bacteroidota bacterium]